MNAITFGRWVKLSWLVSWFVASVIGAVVIANQAIERHRALFETDARIVHRLLSQQVVQHDAILATLALLQPGQSTSERANEASPEQRLTALYPHILAVQRRDRGAIWSDVLLMQADQSSRQVRRAALADVDMKAGRYRLVLGAEPWRMH